MKQAYPRIKQTIATLLVAGLASTCLFSTAFAGYSVTDSAEAHARIALYTMDILPDENNWDNVELEVIETASASQGYVLYNKDSQDNISEVAMTYKFVVELSAPLPQGTTLSLSDINGAVATPEPVEQGGKTVYTFTQSDWEFQADVLGSNTFTLSFFADNTDRTAESSDGAIEVSVCVISEQKSH